MNNFKSFINKNSPVILSIIGVGGVILTTGLTIKATIKATELYNSLENKNELTKKDIVRLCWKEYIPTAISASTTIVCVLGANYLNQRTKASLVSAYYLLQSSYMDYKRAADNLYENGDIKIKQEVCKNNYEKNNIIKINDDTTLFFDYESGTFFESSMDEILKYESQFLNTLNKYGKITLNEWEKIIGNKPLEYGDSVGWCCNEYNNVDCYPEVEINLTPDVMSNGLECVMITFSMPPEFNYVF